MTAQPITLTVNGEARPVDAEARTLLVDVLRDHLGLRGTHIGCDSTSCGACTVLLDGRAVKSCTMVAPQAEGSEIRTVESLAGGPDGPLHPLQEAFEAHFAFQCGYCTPGMLMAALAVYEAGGTPDRSEIRTALTGNLCRCTGYEPIIAAIEAALAAREEVPG